MLVFVIVRASRIFPASRSGTDKVADHFQRRVVYTSIPEKARSEMGPSSHASDCA